jgi:hypothetical protein
MRVPDRRVHGHFDYMMAALFLVAPSWSAFEGEPQLFCYAAGAVCLILATFTAYPLGLLGVLPFRLHGALEALLVPAFAVAPWLLGFWSVVAARNLFLVSAGLLAYVWIITDYKAVTRALPQPSEARQTLDTAHEATAPSPGGRV